MGARSLLAVALLGSATALGGCTPDSYSACYRTDCAYREQPVYYPAPYEDPAAEYTRRSMLISPGAGNAQAANRVLQTDRPWPRYSNDTNIPGNSARLVRTMQEFEDGTRETETAKRAFRTPGNGNGGFGGAAGISR